MTNKKIVHDYFFTLRGIQRTKEDVDMLDNLQSVIEEKFTKKGIKLCGIGDSRLSGILSKLKKEEEKRTGKSAGHQGVHTFVGGHTYKLSLPEGNSNQI
ncbi:MAG: hypothetical protein ACOCUR_01760 [Nanoarchaeota archaeon]